MDKATEQKFAETSERYWEITNAKLEIYQDSTEPLLQRFYSFIETDFIGRFTREVYSELQLDILCAFVIETNFLYNELRRNILRFHDLKQTALEQLREIKELKEKIQRLESQPFN